MPYLKLARDRQRSRSDELQPVLHHLLLLEVFVDELDGEIEGLMDELKVLLNLDEPVDQYRSHVLCHLGLIHHVVGRQKLFLQQPIIRAINYTASKVKAFRNSLPKSKIKQFNNKILSSRMSKHLTN